MTSAAVSSALLHRTRNVCYAQMNEEDCCVHPACMHACTSPFLLSFEYGTFMCDYACTLEPHATLTTMAYLGQIFSRRPSGAGSHAASSFRARFRWLASRKYRRSLVPARRNGLGHGVARVLYSYGMRFQNLDVGWFSEALRICQTGARVTKPCVLMKTGHADDRLIDGGSPTEPAALAIDNDCKTYGWVVSYRTIYVHTCIINTASRVHLCYYVLECTATNTPG